MLAVNPTQKHVCGVVLYIRFLCAMEQRIWASCESFEWGASQGSTPPQSIHFLVGLFNSIIRCEKEEEKRSTSIRTYFNMHPCRNKTYVLLRYRKPICRSRSPYHIYGLARTNIVNTLIRSLEYAKLNNITK